MKKINYIFSLLVLTAFLFTSCDETEELYPRYGEEPGQQYVSFTNGSFSTAESSTSVFADGTAETGNSVENITLVRGGADISSALEVEITYTAAYVDDNDFVSAGEDASEKFEITTSIETLTFEANSAYASFNVVAINDVIPTGDAQVVFTIASVSDSEYQIGNQSGNARSSATFTIIDDDCPIDIPGTWEGIYEVASFDAAPGSFNEGFSPGAAPGRQVEITLDESNPLGTSAILLPTASNSLLAADTEMPLSFVTCPETVLIGDGVYALAFNQNGSSAAIFLADEPETFGNGTFTPDGSQLTLVVSYGNVAGSNFDEFVVVLERVEE